MKLKTKYGTITTDSDSTKRLIRDAEVALIDEIEKGMAEIIKKARKSLKQAENMKTLQEIKDMEGD